MPLCVYGSVRVRDVCARMYAVCTHTHANACRTHECGWNCWRGGVLVMVVTVVHCGLCGNIYVQLIVACWRVDFAYGSISQHSSRAMRCTPPASAETPFSAPTPPSPSGRYNAAVWLLMRHDIVCSDWTGLLSQCAGVLTSSRESSTGTLTRTRARHYFASYDTHVTLTRTRNSN